MAQCGAGAQAGLPLHRDGSLLSFNVLLSRPDAFTGGGTRFPHLAACSDADAHAAESTADAAHADAAGVVRLRQGDALLHGGSALHAGEPVRSGRRLLLVGFVETTRRAQQQQPGQPGRHAAAASVAVAGPPGPGAASLAAAPAEG